METPQAKPGYLYYLGRTLQLLAMIGLGLIAFIFPYVESFVQLLFFTIEGVALFFVGWLLARRTPLQRDE